MKKTILLLISALLLGFSCSEKEEDQITVTYEVITEDGAFWSGEFVDESGERVLTFSLDEYFSETEGLKCQVDGNILLARRFNQLSF